MGIGKPEPLKGKYAGFWSRRITHEHRLVYAGNDKRLYILQCRFTMKSEQLKDDFYPLMKVSLGDDYGVVTDQYWRASDTYSGQAANADLPHYGVIRWDTNKESDYEDWRGLWGTFTEMGGRQIEPDYQFKFINDDGTLKK